MIDLYFWATPNGYKPLIALEELGLAYKIHPIDITAGAQFAPDFLAIAPNNRIPAIVDHAPHGGTAPLSIFESGAILTYLAEKGGALQPADFKTRFDVQQWLFWQMAGLGPNMGQAGHFFIYAKDDVPYAKTRFLDESERLVGVLERRLADRPYIAGDYSIADIASFPWLKLHALISLSLEPYPNVRAWLERIEARPAVIRAYEVGAAVKPSAGTAGGETSDAHGQ